MKTSLWITLIAVLLPFAFVRADDSLIEKLNDNDFFVREKAQKELTKKMDFKLYLELRNFKATDLEEVCRRVEKAVVGYEDKFAQERVNDYRPDLQGYADYPWIDKLPHNYYWNGLGKWFIVSNYLYCAQKAGVVNDEYSKWPNHRKATELWLRARIKSEIRHCLRECKNEKDFRRLMGFKMKAIKEDIQLMIKEEDDWWEGKEKNPLRAGTK